MNSMNKLIFIITIFFISISAFSQDFTGNWSGILMNSHVSPDKADVIYLKIEENSNKLEGITRIELNGNPEEFASKSFAGTQKDTQLFLTENFVRRSSKSRLSPECKLDYELKYNQETGYLKGTFMSTDCRNVLGEVVFFRSDHEIDLEIMPKSTHLWNVFFVRNYKKGYPSPEMLRKEQDEFQFETIHFDFDKAQIRPEYYEYLNRMARVLDAIHDLRVKITGHTDGEGSDYYNMALSERRADALRDYFKKRGVEVEKLDIDFKGKRQPIETNKTKEGRQENRRVVFEFI